MRKTILFFIFLIVSQLSAQIKFNVDLIIHQADIYTANDSIKTAEAMAIYRGKIFAVGNNAEILAKFKAPKVLNFNGHTVVPGYVDVYAPVLGFGTPVITRLEAIKNKTALGNTPQWLFGATFISNENGREKESIEVGKFADFVVLDRNIDKISVKELSEIRVLETYLNGEKMY